MPTVSVVIPVYNQAAYVGAAIDSALHQIHAVDRVIVVDDGSTDDTASICQEYGSRIQYIRQANGGPSAARNTALAAATGDVILFLDSDDVLEREWLDIAMQHINALGNASSPVGVVYGDYLIFSEDGAYEQRITVKSITVEQLLRDSMLIPSGTLVTRTCIRDVGGFNGELDTCEDWDFWLRAVLQGHAFVHVDTVAFRHREHDASLSKGAVKALHRRVRFLEHWRRQPVITAEQRERVRLELARTYLRLRRATFYHQEADESYVARAMDLAPSLASDPWVCVFGAVYASPFFRAPLKRGQVEDAIRGIQREIREHAVVAGRWNRRLDRRVRASGILAEATNLLFARRHLAASQKSVRALLADPTLLLELVRRLPEQLAEIRRARNFV